MGQKHFKRSLLSVLTISALIISCLFSFIFVNADDTSEEPALEGLSIHYMDGTLDVKYQSMRPYIIIHNNSGMDVDMADLRVRYYYEKEGVTEEVLTCFYTAIGADKIFAEFHPELGYAEIGFTSDAGIIKSGWQQRAAAAGTEKNIERLLRPKQ